MQKEMLMAYRDVGGNANDVAIELASPTEKSFAVDAFVALFEYLDNEQWHNAKDALKNDPAWAAEFTPSPSGKKVETQTEPLKAQFEIKMDYITGNITGFLAGPSSPTDGKDLLEHIKLMLEAYGKFDHKEGRVIGMEVKKGKMYLTVEE
jgi:hypothetical protein